MIGATYVPLLFAVFWKSGVALGAALCANRLLWSKSADLRRLVLSTTIATLFMAAAALPILPRLTAVIPLQLGFQQRSHASVSYQPVDQAPFVEETKLATPAVPPAPAQESLRRIDFTPWMIPLIWSLGAAILLGRFTLNLRGLRRLRAASEPVTDAQIVREAARYGRRVRLWQNDTIAAPVTWGIFRPVILVPVGFEALSTECRDAVLCHEVAHIRAGDFLMRSLAEIARAAIWFQPLMWIVRRQLHEEQELACDNRVLASGGKPSAYAKLLLDWDSRPGMDFLIAVGITNRSCLKRRLYALLDPSLRRDTVARAGVAGLWFLALAVALPLAAVSVTQDAPRQPTPVRSIHVDSPATARTPPTRPAAIEITQAAPAPQPAVQRPAPGPATVPAPKFDAASVASGQEDPLTWFPIRVGSRWIYEHEWKSGDRNRPDVDQWTSEETITGWVTIPEGVVVLREVKEQDSSTGQTVRTKVIAPDGQLRELPRIAHPAYLVARDREPYLIRGNCVYVIGEGWDRQKQRLRPSYQEYLAKDALSADFCFPLQMGRQWGNKDVPWIVDPARGGVASFLPAEYAGAIHIFSGHFGSGGWEDVWFQQGIGVVGEHYTHNGTYDEYTKKLVWFTP